MQLFKVLDQEGRPAHGGTGTYPLPTARRAGTWTTAVRPAACASGYHLTSRPASWWKPGARLFVAEFRGAVDFSPPDKIACESVRLTEEVTLDWPLLSIFSEIRALVHNFLAARQSRQE